MRHNALFQLCLARLRDLLRMPEALFWVFVFPVLLTLVLGFAFRSSGPADVPVAVLEGEGATAIFEDLDGADELTVTRLDEDEARRQLRGGQVDVVVIPGEPWSYWFDPTRPESRQARLLVDDRLQRSAGRTDVVVAGKREMKETGSRYIDFLVPGLLGMNLMGTGMWGIGFNIVQTRSQHLLRRLIATPMRRSDYLFAQILGRLVFLVPEVALLVGFAYFVFDVPLRGSIVALSSVCLLGATTFAGLGLLVAARPRTIEGVSGLMNLVMMPMWLGSGVFFSTGRFPDVVQPFVQALPLTALNDALRALMLDGASLLSVAGELGIVAAWGLVSFAVALAVFRWD